MPAKKNTNKTAHVLNLISTSKDDQAKNAEGDLSEALPTADVSEAAPSPNAAYGRQFISPVLTDLHAGDETVAEAIRGALASELGIDQAEEDDLPADDASPIPSPAEEPAAQRAGSESPQSYQAVDAQSEPSPKAPAAPLSGDQAAQTAGAPDTPPKITYVNIMRELVESIAESYMDLAGVCKCPRCRADVCALALTNLPSKYVVVGESEVVPLLGVYERRYRSSISVHLMQACRTVAQKPHHNRALR